MKLRTMTLILIMSILMVLASYSSNALADTKDGFVYVAALEKDSPDELSTMWNPTLYKISVEKGSIVNRVKIADQGAPIACESIGDGRIRVILHEGIASNGTRPGELITREIIINKNTMAIVESKTVQGIDEKKVPIEELLKSRKAPTAVISKIPKGERFLANSSIGPRVFVLTDYSQKRDLSVKMLDANSFQEIESIPLNVGNRKLGGFNGIVNTLLLNDRFLICLFDGESPLGEFAPGYVMIVDTYSKRVQYVAIGSNPTLGISY